MARTPSGPRTVIVPPRASTAAGRSDAGSAWASEPASVPRWRTCGSPTLSAAALSKGTCSRSTSLETSSQWRASPPTTTSSPSSRISDWSGTSFTSTSTDGVASRSFIRGSSEWPPARSLASSPCSRSASSASSTERARTNENGAGITPRPRGPRPARDLHVPGAGDDRGHDVLVPGASAEVALEPDAHVVGAEVGVLGRQRDRGHDHPGRAVPALQPVVGLERLLHRVQPAVVGEPLDRRDRVIVRLHREHRARLHRSAVEEHGACAAGRRVASHVRPREPEGVAHEVDEKGPGGDHLLGPGAVDREPHHELGRGLGGHRPAPAPPATTAIAGAGKGRSGERRGNAPAERPIASSVDCRLDSVHRPPSGRMGSSHGPRLIIKYLTDTGRARFSERFGVADARGRALRSTKGAT